MSDTKADWIAVEDRLPTEVDFVWVHDAGENYLAYFNGRAFQCADSAGDAEGLSVEYIQPTHWASCDPPANAPASPPA